MKQIPHLCKLLVVQALFLSAVGCGNKSPRTKNNESTPAQENIWPGFKPNAKESTGPKPGSFTRANFMRLAPDLPEEEVINIFGMPNENSPESNGTKKYTWKSGNTKLQVTLQGGKVLAAHFPGQFEEHAKINQAYQAARALWTPISKYVLTHNNRLPNKLDDLDLTDLKAHPKAMEALNRGDVVVPWGKSANRIVWAYWKETPEFGGPYIRFDSQSFDRVSPQEFAKLNETVLTSATIPEDIIAKSRPTPGEKDPFGEADRGAKGSNTQGFFTAGVLQQLLVSKPASLDELPKHLVRHYSHLEVLKKIEKGEIIVRWDRDPKQGGVYAYPRGFPRASSWAIYKNQWVPFRDLEEAKKAFDE